MRHSSLLSKFDSESVIGSCHQPEKCASCSSYMRTLKRVTKQNKVLKAVIGFHEETNIAPNGDKVPRYCKACTELSGQWVIYPCPTIQAIERELK